MNAAETSSAFEALAPNPECGLSDEVFLSLTRLTPMINVDLLIRDGAGRVLLTWREDQFYPAGWHIPGGIILNSLNRNAGPEGTSFPCCTNVL